MTAPICQGTNSSSPKPSASLLVLSPEAISRMRAKMRVTEICPGRVETEFFQVAVGEEAAKQAYAGFEILQSQDVADAILYALDVPWRVNIGRIELTPTEQHVGGVTIAPVEKG